jgi:DNA-binding MarR family transcriptional regulator
MAGKILIKANPALELDPLVHERVRLAILASLGAHEELSFNELKGLTQATDGNLSTHTQRLEAAGLIRARRGPRRTTYRITAAGQRALSNYLDGLERLLGELQRGQIAPQA